MIFDETPMAPATDDIDAVEGADDAVEEGLGDVAEEAPVVEGDEDVTV